VVTELLAETSAALGTAFCIQDVNGMVLLGAPPSAGHEKFSILMDGQAIGWVSGGQGSQALAHWLAHLADQAIEIESLADEALNRYREVNLLYSLSGKLTASLDPRSVCSVTLEESRRLIQSTAGGVMLLDEAGQAVVLSAGFGLLPGQVMVGAGLIGVCAQTGKAEVVNETVADPRCSPAERKYGALLCAPLESRGHLLGLVVLANESPDAYTAGDLKLLNTLASQSAPVIENALLHEKMLREAQAREARLQEQIQALRIELDESRQAKKVAEITETDYFKNLLQQADDLRQIVETP
jgi:transcriptional regulator with GAF, ATPase, and Fis domain